MFCRTISQSGVFYCHPQLLRSLGVHLTVLGLMRSYLGISVAGLEEDSFLTARRKMKMAMSKVWVACCISDQSVFTMCAKQSRFSW